MTKMSRFECNTTGFSMAFRNGVRISVQFGNGNYCSNRHKEHVHDLFSSRTAEIAIMPTDDKGGAAEWFDFGGDTVKGWVTTDEVALWIEAVSGVESFEALQEARESMLQIMKMLTEEEE